MWGIFFLIPYSLHHRFSQFSLHHREKKRRGNPRVFILRFLCNCPMVEKKLMSFGGGGGGGEEREREAESLSKNERKWRLKLRL